MRLFGEICNRGTRDRTLVDLTLVLERVPASSET